MANDPLLPPFETFAIQLTMKKLLSNLFLSALVLGVTVSATSCVKVQVEPITVDVRVQLDEDLDDFFGDLDRKSSTLK